MTQLTVNVNIIANEKSGFKSAYIAGASDEDIDAIHADKYAYIGKDEDAIIKELIQELKASNLTGKLKVNRMTDNGLPVDCCDHCPIHNKNSYREYTFGKHHDATVYVHECGCATHHTDDSYGLATLYSSYKDASNHANFTKQRRYAQGW